MSSAPTTRGANYMSDNNFGELLRSRRTQLRLSLRAFAERAGMDPGNASRLERGRMSPPEAAEVLNRVANALDLEIGSTAYETLMDAAAAAKGRIPQDLITDEEVISRLPILFRTLRSKPLSGEQLDKLIDSIRKA